MSNVRSLHDISKKDDPSKKKTSSFTGGEKSGLAVENPDESDSSASPWPGVQRTTGPMPPGSRKVVVYRNGFVVDDGEFRPKDVPENQKFLRELEAGFAPRELQSPAGGDQVHVGLEDKRDEDFVPPPGAKYELFSGEGYSMGSKRGTSSAAAPIDLAKGHVQVDESKSVTTIQFRLHNGQRVAQRFNENHTVGDLHSFLMEVAPIDVEYKLLHGFPPSEITHPPTTTLKDAGLLQAAIKQQMS